MAQLYKEQGMKKSFIFGCTSLGRVLFHYLSKEGRAPNAFVVDDAYRKADSFFGLPLIPSSALREACPPEEYEAYVAIGYTNMNAVREKTMRGLRSEGYELPNFIHSSVIREFESIGVGNLVFPGVILDAFTQLGDGNVLYPGGMVSHDTIIGSYNFFAPRAALAGDVAVGNRCFFGLNCTVKNEVRIEDRCLIGAGAYVNRSLAPGSVLVPPRSVLLDRDSEEAIRGVIRKG